MQALKVPQGTLSQVQRMLFCFARQTHTKILRKRSFNQQMCSFPKWKFDLSRAHRNAFITDQHLEHCSGAVFNTLFLWCLMLSPPYPTPKGSEVVSMSCNGNGSYFFLQSSLIAVIWSKCNLTLTTTLTFQTKLPYKLGPTDQLTMLNEKCVLEDGSSGILCTWCFFLYI